MGDTYYGKFGELPDYVYGDSRLNALNMQKKQRNKLIKFDKGWLQPKQLMLMPSRLAIAMQEDGWILRNDIIWHKPNPMPSSVKDRLNTTFEHLFHFVKSKKYYYDLDSIRDAHETLYEPFNRRVRDVKAGRIASGQYRATIQEIEQTNKLGVPWVQYNGKFKDTMSHFESVSERKNYQRQVLGIPHDLATCNPKGKNPGDTVKYASIQQEALYRQGMYGGRELEFVEFRPLLPSKQEFIDGLRKNFTVNGLVEKTRLPKTTVEHWFRSDDGFAFPSKEDWEKVDSDFFRNELTYTESKPAFATYNSKGKNPGDFLSITTQPFPQAHFAVYPVALCEKPIKSSCPDDGICLDPFCGAGTTWVALKKYKPNAKFIGFEIKKEYIDMAYLRVGKRLDTGPLLNYA